MDETEKSLSATKKIHMKGLDGLRGLAVISVILYHMYPSVFKGGFLGVSLFFVLSGYLIAVTSENNWSKGDFKTGFFYKKRLKRIYPPLFIVVFATVGLAAILTINVWKGSKTELASIILGYNNWWQISQNASYFTRIANASPFRHLWSLSIEIQFYLLWPLLFLFHKYLQNRGFKEYSHYIYLALSILSFFVLQFAFRENDISRAYYGTDTRMFSLFLGAFTGTMQYRRGSRKTTYRQKRIYLFEFVVCMSFFLIACVCMDGEQELTYRIWLLVTSFLFCKIINLAVHANLPLGGWLDRRPLKWIGKRSYEIYLWHYPVIFLFQYLKIPITPLYAILIMCIILVLALWTHLIISDTALEGRSVKGVVRRCTIPILAAFVCFGGVQSIVASNETLGSTEQLQAELQRNSQNLQEQKEKQAQENNAEEEQTKDFQTVIGDSVMLGASPSVMKALPQCIVDAEESRQVSAAADIVNSLETQGKLGDTVIIALGTNGAFQSETGQALIEHLGKNRDIYWITAYGRNLTWQDNTNKTIYELGEKNSNVHIIDWAGAAASHDEWFYDDGIHLNEIGQEAYAEFISNSLLPE